MNGLPRCGSGPKNCTHSGYPAITAVTQAATASPPASAPDPAGHLARAAGGEDRGQQDPGQRGVEQDLLADQQLRRHQQAQPEAAAPGAGRGR